MPTVNVESRQDNGSMEMCQVGKCECFTYKCLVSALYSWCDNETCRNNT